MKEKASTTRRDGKNDAPAPKALTALIGCGASAVATDGLIRFFESAGALPGVSHAIVMQRREALDEATFTKRLEAASGLPVETMRNNGRPQPGRIYLAPPNLNVSIKRGRFRAQDARQLPGERGTIDTFLISLAVDLEEAAVGIIFAGTGSDGTLGIASLKENGSLAIAEIPVEGPAHGDLPTSPSAMADAVLGPAEMAARIASHVANLGRASLGRNFDELADQLSPQLTRVATILRNQTGHDFHGYKRNTFLRRVQRRIQVTQTETVDAYLDYLKRVPDEAQALFNDLLIGVTHFFRDQKEFDFLEREVVPKLFEGKTAGDHLRVWVLGCATGEEAYSIAILLRERMATLDAVPNVQIFATDIDGRALAQARVGRYAGAAIRDVTPDRLARWFVKEGDTWCVVKELREMCIFSQHNVIRDAPFSRLDLISCRNLLIYLNADLQNRVIPLFHFALRPGGYLFLGNSENVTRHSKLFVPVDRRFRIFRQQDSQHRVLPDFPLTATAERRLLPDRPLRHSTHAVGPAALVKQAERIMERHAPAYMIIDENHDILHFSGRTGRYIDPPTGMASLNLPNLIHRDLRMDLRAALHKVEADKRPVRVAGLKVGQNGYRLDVTMIVEPLETAAGHPSRYAVILQDGHVSEEASPASEAGNGQPRSGQRADVERLEAELRLTRDRLQSTIEELESTNEELKASNEEYQSVNEELQSSNEELETSKEELQSLNEELQTVNGELAHRVEELGRANSDLKNLLESTQIATVFLDNDLRVKSFTPAITELFHLIESDLGRPIGHIAARIAYEDLESDVRKVLRTLGSIERDIRSRTGSRYLARVLPYRSIDNVIEGVVLTFIDVTPVVRAEERLRESEGRLRSIVEGIPQLVWRSDEGGRWTWSSPQWTAFTGQAAASAIDHGWLEKVHPDDRRHVLETWSQAARTGTLELDHRVWCQADHGYRSVRTRAVPIRNDGADTGEWLGTSTDVNEILQLQQKQKVLLAELQHRVRNTLAVIRSLARRTGTNSRNVEEYVRHLEGRIDALARVQSILTRAPASSVDMQNLLRDELLAQGGVRDGNGVTLDGPDVRLSGKAAENLSLAFHELATNAVKYGALSAEPGLLAVNWEVVENGGTPLLRIRWREQTPKSLVEPKGKGFGTELIEQLVPYELQGKGSLEFDSRGVVCTIELPVSESVRVEAGAGRQEN